MVNLKVDEAEVPISEKTLQELQIALEEMKKKNLTKCHVSSPCSKTVFVLSTNNESSLHYTIGNRNSQFDD